MKTKQIISFSLGILFFLSTFTVFALAPEQELKKEERKISHFSGIGIGVAADVYLRQGNETKLIVEGDPGVLDELKTEVRGDMLNIRFDSWRIKNYKRLNIYITTPEIDEISVAGSAKVIAETSVKTDRLEFNISGSGSIKIDDLDVKRMETSISGSGNLYLSGNKTAEFHEINISGSGSMETIGIPVDEFDVAISGSGTCKIFANKKVYAAISGSGRVYYKGDPLVDASISGSGKVKPLD